MHGDDFMNPGGAIRPGWGRRGFLQGGAAALAGLYGMAPRYGLAADIPLQYDGSKFQLAAPEPNPKRGGVLRYAITSRPPHFDVHQSGTINSLGSQGCMFDNLVRRDPRDSGADHHPRPGAQLGHRQGRQDLYVLPAQGCAVP